MQQKSPLYPLQFRPNLFELVWGGKQLCPFKGLPADDRKIGESWEVSNVPNKESVVATGALQGQTLRQVIETYGETLLGHSVAQKFGNNFPLLVKFIDADQPLSIQVHPNDTLAQQRHQCSGKSEMWLVLSAQPGAYLYAGFKQRVTKEEYVQHVANDTICDVLKKHEVKPGDIFYIPAGRIHAIGKGITLVEVQQSSDITYRIYDYGRMGLDGKPRQLHTELAVDAIDYRVIKDYQTHYSFRTNKPIHVVTCPFFQINLLVISDRVVRHLKKCDSFIVLSCLSGAVSLQIEGQLGVIELTQGNSCLIPAAIANYVLTNMTTEKTRVLESFIDNFVPWYKRLFRPMLGK